MKRATEKADQELIRHVQGMLDETDPLKGIDIVISRSRSKYAKETPLNP